MTAKENWTQQHKDATRYGLYRMIDHVISDSADTVRVGRGKPLAGWRSLVIRWPTKDANAPAEVDPLTKAEQERDEAVNELAITRQRYRMEAWVAASLYRELREILTDTDNKKGERISEALECLDESLAKRPAASGVGE